MNGALLSLEFQQFLSLVLGHKQFLHLSPRALGAFVLLEELEEFVARSLLKTFGALEFLINSLKVAGAFLLVRESILSVVKNSKSSLTPQEDVERPSFFLFLRVQGCV